MRTVTSWSAVALATAVLLLSACVPEQRFYADAGRSEAYYGAIRKGPAQTVQVEVEFKQNGSDAPEVNDYLYKEISRVMVKSGTFTATQDANADAHMKVVVDDKFEKGNKGDYFMSGLTLGQLSAVSTTDKYDFNLSWRGPTGGDRYGRYHHAIWVGTGKHAETPSDRGPFTNPNDAFAIVLEDVVLNFLKDVVEAGDSDDDVMFVPTSK